MIKYTPTAQLSISEFSMPFECNLNPKYRWVRLSQIVEWDVFAREYYKNFTSKEGCTPIDARVVLGAVIIKHFYVLSDIDAIEMIKENPYLQYFIGYKGFTDEPAFDPSLFVSIRKRMGEELFDRMTGSLMKQALTSESKRSDKLKAAARAGEKKKDTDPTSGGESACSTSADSEAPSQKTPLYGKLQIDATVADADIKYPTDLGLLNDSREKSELLIDRLCELLPGENRPRTYRRVARAEFLSVSKKKKKSKKEIRRAIRLQINYLERNMRSINLLLDKLPCGQIPFSRKMYKYFLVIGEVLRQQKEMFQNRTHSCQHRIVSIHQPHVRPIVRGKAKTNVEFGNKIDVCLQNGVARIGRFDWEAYNEGADLPRLLEEYKTFWGFYPELVQVDKIYLTRENRKLLKFLGIRHSGDPLGRKPKAEKLNRYQRAKRRREAAERNQIEGKFGQGKRRYALNNIRAKLTSTSPAWISSIFLVMNLLKVLFCSFFVRFWLLGRATLRRIERTNWFVLGIRERLAPPQLHIA